MLTLLETFDTLPVGWQLILTLITVFVLFGTAMAVTFGFKAKKETFKEKARALNRQAEKEGFHFLAFYDDSDDIGCLVSGKRTHLATVIRFCCQENPVLHEVIVAGVCKEEKERRAAQ
jgi:hypothetical protein